MGKHSQRAAGTTLCKASRSFTSRSSFASIMMPQDCHGKVAACASGELHPERTAGITHLTANPWCRGCPPTSRRPGISLLLAADCSPHPPGRPENPIQHAATALSPSPRTTHSRFALIAALAHSPKPYSDPSPGTQRGRCTSCRNTRRRPPGGGRSVPSETCPSFGRSRPCASVRQGRRSTTGLNRLRRNRGRCPPGRRAARRAGPRNLLRAPRRAAPQLPARSLIRIGRGRARGFLCGVRAPPWVRDEIRAIRAADPASHQRRATLIVTSPASSPSRIGTPRRRDASALRDNDADGVSGTDRVECKPFPSRRRLHAAADRARGREKPSEPARSSWLARLTSLAWGDQP